MKAQCGKMKHLLSPKRKFRQTNYLVIFLVKMVFSRNFFQKSEGVNFGKVSIELGIFREINSLHRPMVWILVKS